ncbi:hypothetical protein D3C77_358980 [compost metagenome]
MGRARIALRALRISGNGRFLIVLSRRRCDGDWDQRQPVPHLRVSSHCDLIRYHSGPIDLDHDEGYREAAAAARAGLTPYRRRGPELQSALGGSQRGRQRHSLVRENAQRAAAGDRRAAGDGREPQTADIGYFA